MSPLNRVVAGKRIELLKEPIPRLSRMAVLRNPTNTGSALVLRATEDAARQLDIQLQVVEARSVEELEIAFRAAVTGQARALMLVTDNLFFTQRSRILELAATHRLPAMFDTKDFVEAGGLMSYGANLEDCFVGRLPTSTRF